ELTTPSEGELTTPFRRNINTTQAQQKALDDALVALEDRLEFGKCNMRFKTEIKPKEATFQVVLDALALTPFYRAFLITADVPVIYMKEFWATVSVHKDLGHTGDITYLTDVNVDYLHQPWREFAIVINKCLSGKETGMDKIHLLFQIENKDAKNTNKMSYPRFTKIIIDYFMSKDQSISRRNKMFWHTARDDTMFTSMRCISRHEDTQVYGTILPKELTNQVMLESKAYKTYYAFASREKTPKPKYVRKKADSVTSPKQKPVQATKGTRLKTKAKEAKFDKKKQPAKKPKAKGLAVLSDVALTEAEQLKLATKRSKIQFHSSHASGSGDGVDTQSKVPDEHCIYISCCETLNKKNTTYIQDLIFKEKIESQSKTTQIVSALKLLVLKTRDYDLCSMRMEQYLTHTNYALWEVIVNGDAPAIASASAGTEGPIPPKTAEQKLARKNELKAKSTLLLAILDEHLLKFHGIKDAKTLWEAIKARSKGLDKTYDRFQKLISQLEIHGEVYEYEIKVQSTSSSNSQNVAFVSLENTSSINEVVNTAHEVSTASSQGQSSSSTYAAPRNQGNRNGDAPRRVILVETPTNALVVQDGIVTLENLYPMDDEPMWAADHVVAPTPGSAITIPETANEFFAIKDTKNEVVRLMMFPLSLTGEAKTWLYELNEGTIETWDELRNAFIS
ncbi:hypothetical protein Tco_0686704, partial [Tanacetum coccineum]